MKDVRVAVTVFNSPVGKSSYNIGRMERWIEKAGENDAAVICFPELNITGYTTGKDIIDTAEPAKGPNTSLLLDWSAKHNIVILAGMAEKDITGRIFASHLIIKPDGDIGIYRKLHLAPPERSFFTPGNQIPLFEASGIKFGIQLCYDAHFPELSTHMALNGADIIFIPHASPRGTPDEKYRSWIRHLKARAYDNSLFVVACNQTGKNQRGLEFPGVGVVIGPSGEITGKDLSGKENMIIADLKADDLKRVRNHEMRFFLPNRRPELYK